jgi:mono/diheme cytochrome c family protein
MRPARESLKKRAIVVPAKAGTQVFALVLAMLAAPLWAQDAGRGKALYETHCLSCHYERIHERDPARSLVRSQAQLRAEVARWGQLTPQRFTLEDLDDIAAYLNASHYRFDK